MLGLSSDKGIASYELFSGGKCYSNLDSLKKRCCQLSDLVVLECVSPQFPDFCRLFCGTVKPMVPDTPPTSRPLLGNTNGINRKYKYMTTTSRNGNGIDKNTTCLDNDFCNAFILILQNKLTMEVIQNQPSSSRSIYYCPRSQFYLMKSKMLTTVLTSLLIKFSLSFRQVLTQHYDFLSYVLHPRVFEIYKIILWL